ncbi:hypothetical protein RA27_20970 [Ruegeria sp. ANG-R]|nr:hypothetical protein RA27_20970 [Ruegeria sp. ANG-R]
MPLSASRRRVFPISNSYCDILKANTETDLKKLKAAWSRIASTPEIALYMVDFASPDTRTAIEPKFRQAAPSNFPQLM